LKLIFILYSTPSFRTKDCFLKDSRSPEEVEQRERDGQTTERECQRPSGRVNAECVLIYAMYKVLPWK
jgi:hypothetical protein